MTAIPVVVVSESYQFHLEICCRPKQEPIQTLSANCSDQSLSERMRPRNVWNRLNLRNVRNSKVGLLLMKPIQPIVIGAQIFRQACTADSLLEHSAELQAIDHSSLNSE